MKTIRFFIFIWIVVLFLSSLLTAPSFGQEIINDSTAVRIAKNLQAGLQVSREEVKLLQEYFLVMHTELYDYHEATGLYKNITKAAVVKLLALHEEQIKYDEILNKLDEMDSEVKSLKDSLQSLNEFARTAHQPEEYIDYSKMSLPKLRNLAQNHMYSLWASNGISSTGPFEPFISYRQEDKLKERIVLIMDEISERESKQRVAKSKSFGILAGEPFNLSLNSEDNIKAFIAWEAFRNGVPPELALAIALHESGFKPRAHSRTTAIGIYQFVEKTWRDTMRRMGRSQYVGLDYRYNPKLNIEAAIWLTAPPRYEYKHWYPYTGNKWKDIYERHFGSYYK